jgi:hypothetical protein
MEGVQASFFEGSGVPVELSPASHVGRESALRLLTHLLRSQELGSRRACPSAPTGEAPGESNGASIERWRNMVLPAVCSGLVTGCPLFFNSGVASVSDAAGSPSRAPGVQSAPRGVRCSFSRERRFGQRPDRPRGLRSLRLCSRRRLPSEARRSPSRRFLPLGRRVKVPSIGRLSQERRSGTGANGRDHGENVAKLLEQGRIEPAQGRP